MSGLLTIARRFFPILAILGLLAGCGGGSDPEQKSERAPAPREAQVIVKFKRDALSASAQRISSELTRQLSTLGGMNLTPVGETALGSHVLRLPKGASLAQAQAVAQRLNNLSEVLYAEPDLVMHHTVVPNDPDLPRQWAHVEPESVPGAMNTTSAWGITTGTSNVTVAVVDTGILAHQELQGRILPGYDFVSDSRWSNDGNGRDSDPSDPGDWLTAQESISLGGYGYAEPSSWHGTHIAGIIAASGNNGRQVAGINWQAKILPVRVLGKGGGLLSDIADGIVWASGGHVNGVPDNPNPAKVINLSLGGSYPTCPATYQTAIDFALSRKISVVVSSGNENIDVSGSAPGNCNGVIVVGSNSRSGSRAYYSNYGSRITITAPGGDSKLDSTILSLGDGGKTAPQHDNSLLFMEGTSMAAPQVSGVISLMLSVNPDLTPTQIGEILRFSARKFPTGTSRDCNTSTCGAGLLNAFGAVQAAASRSGYSIQPESGWWWNPNESGRGFAIEMHNGQLFFASFLYSDNGQATWTTSQGKMSSDTSYSGALYSFSGGQTLLGNYKPPTQGASPGSLSIKFSDARHGTLSWPGGTVAIERFSIAAGTLGQAQTNFTPERGWWWNPSESGRGFAIEVQGNTLFISGFMYGDDGKPVWYVSSGKMSSPNHYEGCWEQYANGQTLTSAYRPATRINACVGGMSLTFSDSRNAVLALPNGRQVTLSRFVDLGGNALSPVTGLPESQNLAMKLFGVWQYRFGSSKSRKYSFDSTFESPSEPGLYYAMGLSETGTSAAGSYEPSLNAYMVVDVQTSYYWDVFVFNLDTTGKNLIEGEYCEYWADIDKFTHCSALSGYWVSNVSRSTLNKRAASMPFVPETSLARIRKVLADKHRQGL